MKILSVSFLLLLILATGLPGSAQTEAEKSGVISAVEKLFSAISQRDLEGVRDCWSAATLKEPAFQQYLERLKARFTQKEPLIFSHFEYFRWSKRDPRIFLRLRYIQQRQEEQSEPYLVSHVWDARFVREGDAWKWEIYGVVAFEEAYQKSASSEERLRLMQADPECVTLGTLQSLLRQSVKARQSGQSAEAKRLLTISMEMATFARHPLWLALCHFTQGQQAVHDSLPASAWKEYRRAMELYRKADDRRGEMLAMNEAASALMSMGRYDAAVKQLQPALELAREMGDSLSRSRILTNMGILYRLMGQPGIALKIYRESLEHIKVASDPVGQGRIYLAMGVAYAEQGEFKDSIEALQKAREVFQSVGSVEDEVAALHNLALVYTSGKQYVHALETMRACERLQREERSRREQARDLLVQVYICLMAERDREAEETLRLLLAWEAEIGEDQAARAYTYQGQLHMRGKRWGEAARAFSRAVERAESLRTGTIDPLLRASLFPRFFSSYWGLAESLRMLSVSQPDRLFDSFTASDLSKVRSLMDLIRHGRPENDRPASLEKIDQRLLKSSPDLCLLSYFVGEEKTLLYALTAGRRPSDPAQLSVYTIPITQTQLERQVNAYWQRCQRQESNYQEEARSLYRTLLEPAQEQIDGKRALIIAADGILQRLPFHALLDAQGRWTIERFRISYAPSIETLLLLCETGDQRRKNWRAPSGSNRYALLAMGGVEEDIPEARRELERVARLFGVGARLYTGRQATREKAIAEMEKARYVLFSTHGIANESVPLYSALQFYGTEEESRLLYAADILPLKLNAELVTLSACESAIGGEFRGEGVVGMAWALFAAGAPSVIVTQWQIQDDSAAQLMVALYQQMKAGMRKDGAAVSRSEALRRAMLSVRRTHPHPYHWAPYFLIGDWR